MRMHLNPKKHIPLNAAFTILLLWRLFLTYQKLFALRVCGFPQTHVLHGTIFPHDSSRIYQDNRHGCQRKQILNLPDEQSKWQDRRTRKALMHTIACVQSRRWCAPVDRSRSFGSSSLKYNDEVEFAVL